MRARAPQAHARRRREAVSVRTSLIWFTALLPAFLAASRPLLQEVHRGTLNDSAAPTNYSYLNIPKNVPLNPFKQ